MKVLIFGTSYCDTMEKLNLMEQWVKLHAALNPNCELMLVDSNSPLKIRGMDCVMQYRLPDNIGHLSRGGRDGWGRAFCAGLQYATDKGYDFVVHIEGDSLCRLDVMRLCEEMRRTGNVALGAVVQGTKRIEFDWLETGLMFFEVAYLQRSRLVDRYDWQDGKSKKYPHTPEAVLFEIIGDDLTLMEWAVQRDDVGHLNDENVKLCAWVTHTTPDVYDAFVANAMQPA